MATSTTSSTSYSATAPVTRDDLDAAKGHVRQCEDEIESIKGALRRLSSVEDGDQPNQLDISMLKWQGLPEEFAPTPAVTLQLSSPVEEIRLDQLWDPLAATSSNTTTTSTNTESSEDHTSSNNKSMARFSGVETSMATLTVTVHHRSSNTEHDPLGTSESIDVSLLCPLNAMNPQDVYLVEWPVTIAKTTTTTTTSTTTSSDAEPTMAAEASAEEAKETDGTTSDAKQEETDKETSAATETADVATAPTTGEETPGTTSTTLGTVTLRVTYKPSAKDQQEALYELLNKASQRKSLALEHLRQVSLNLSRSGPADSTTTTTGTNNNNKKPTIKPGFLKSSSSKTKKPNRFAQWYQNTLGPQSMLRVIVPAAKNYIIFFAAVILFHYKGQELALPPPV